MSNRPFICKHDQLARQCTICDLEEDVAELKEQLKFALKALHTSREYFRWIAEDYSTSEKSCDDMQIEGEGLMEEVDEVIKRINDCL